MQSGFFKDGLTCQCGGNKTEPATTKQRHACQSLICPLVHGRQFITMRKQWNWADLSNVRRKRLSSTAPRRDKSQAEPQQQVYGHCLRGILGQYIGFDV